MITRHQSSGGGISKRKPVPSTCGKKSSLEKVLSSIEELPKETSAIFVETRARFDAVDARLNELHGRSQGDIQAQVPNQMQEALPQNKPVLDNVPVASVDVLDDMRNLAKKRPKTALSHLRKEMIFARSPMAKVIASGLLRSGAGERFPEAERFPKDYAAALKMVKDALMMDEKCLDALVQKGDMLTLGLGVKPDPETAESCFREALRDGFVGAAFLLGKYLYREALERQSGRQVHERLMMMREAKEMLEEALSGGDGRASCVLGYAFERDYKVHNIVAAVFAENMTVEQCEAAAVRIYKEGTRLGTPQAINNLGHVFLSGLGGVRRSTTIALELFTRATEAGLARAYANAGQICEQELDEESGIPSYRRLGVDEARKWYERGAAMGDAFSTYCLGRLNADGALGIKDMEEPERLLFRSIEMSRDNETPDKAIQDLSHCTLSRIYISQAAIDVENRAHWWSKLSNIVSVLVGKEMKEGLEDLLITASYAEVSRSARVEETGLSAQEAVVELRELYGKQTKHLLLSWFLAEVRKVDVAILTQDAEAIAAIFRQLSEVLSPSSLDLLKRMRTIAMDNRIQGTIAPAAVGPCTNSPVSRLRNDTTERGETESIVGSEARAKTAPPVVPGPHSARPPRGKGRSKMRLQLPSRNGRTMSALNPPTHPLPRTAVPLERPARNPNPDHESFMPQNGKRRQE